MAVIDELLIGLGFDYDDKEVKKFTADVDRTTSVIKKLAFAATAAATAITGMVVATTAASDEQGKFAGEIGESVENIDALQFALTRAGGSAEGMTNSLRSLAARASEAARGVGSGVEIFGMLGVSTTNANGELKSTTQLMKEISSEFQGLNKAQQIEFAEKLGIRDAILLLQQGPGEIQNLIDTAKALGVTTAEDAALSADFQDSLVDIWKIMKQISRTITRELAPGMNGMLDKITDWWEANRKVIEQKFPEFLRKITIAMKLFAIATAAWIGFRLVLHIAQLVKMMSALKLQVMLTNAAAAFLPAVIIAGIAAIALLAEDAKTFFEGGDSFIGDMIKKFPQWADEIEFVAAILATLADLAVMVFNSWKTFFSWLFSGGVFDDLSAMINQVKIDFLDLMATVKEFAGLKFDALLDTFRNIFTDVKNLFKDTAISMFEDFKALFINPITEPLKKIKSFFFKKDEDSDENITEETINVIKNITEETTKVAKNITEEIKPGTIDNIKKSISLESISNAIEPIPEGNLGSVRNTRTTKTNNINVDNVNITVPGAGNPDQVAQAVNDMFQQTAQDLTTTVDQ